MTGGPLVWGVGTPKPSSNGHRTSHVFRGLNSIADGVHAMQHEVGMFRNRIPLKSHGSDSISEEPYPRAVLPA